MNLSQRVRAIFCGPRLKNRRDGLAWIKRFGAEYGGDALAGRIVRTVAVVHGGAWQIDPPQRFTVTGNGVHFIYNGVTVAPGLCPLVCALSDDLLEPMPQVSANARDESARWLPRVPIFRSKERA